MTSLSWVVSPSFVSIITLMSRKLIITAYDVAHPRRLQKAREQVTEWAHGGQKSVWECFSTSWERQTLSAQMLGIINTSEDRLALLVPSGPVEMTLGISMIARDEPLIYIG